MAIPPRVGKSPPEDLLARLQSILPTVQLLNVDGARSWWLMDYVPNPERMDKHHRQYMREYDKIKDGRGTNRIVLLVLDWGRQGWVKLGTYWEAEDGSLPAETLEHDLKRMQSATPADLERAFEATLEHSTGGEKRAAARAKVNEYFDQEGRSIFRYAKGARGVVVQGTRDR